MYILMIQLLRYSSVYTKNSSSFGSLLKNLFTVKIEIDQQSYHSILALHTYIIKA
jgi:hypothetical protein